MNQRERTYAVPGTVAASINGRVRLDQIEYLQQVADDLGTTLSGALRRAIDQARLLEAARQNEELRDALRDGDRIVDEDGRERSLGDIHGFDVIRRLVVTDDLDTERDPA